VSNPFATAATVLARSVLGTDAIYVPQSGAPRSVRIVLSREEGDVLPGPARLSGAGYVAMLPVAAVCERPLRGEGLSVGNQEFEIENAELDPEGASWRLTLREP